MTLNSRTRASRQLIGIGAALGHTIRKSGEREPLLQDQHVESEINILQVIRQRPAEKLLVGSVKGDKAGASEREGEPLRSVYGNKLGSARPRSTSVRCRSCFQ